MDCHHIWTVAISVGNACCGSPVTVNLTKFRSGGINSSMSRLLLSYALEKGK